MHQIDRQRGRRRARGVATLAVAAMCSGALAAPSAAGATDGGSDRSGHLRVGGRTRTYLVHTPPGGGTGRPVLLAFHGGGGTSAGMNRLTHLSAVADRRHFVVVYPQGYGNSWAAGKGDTPADVAGIDDVAFVRALVDQLAREEHIDRTRVFATGHSSGGFMAERLGCELADRIAGIAPVSATLLTNLAPTCNPPRPMPVLLIQGTADPLVPYEGGHVRGRGPGGYPALSAPATVAHWARVNGCPPVPTAAVVPTVVADGTEVRTSTFGPCRGGPVVLYTVIGGGHTWPNGEQYAPVRVVGRTTHQFDAGETMWQFFAGLPRRT